MLAKDLQDEIIQSLKKGDSVRVSTLRYLLAAVTNAGIAKYGSESDAKLTDADILDVVKKQVKTHRESIEAFTRAGRSELADKEKAELAILESYLPKQMSDEEIRALLAPVVAGGQKEFGLLMKSAMAVVAGRADGGKVAGILKQMLG